MKRLTLLSLSFLMSAAAVPSFATLNPTKLGGTQVVTFAVPNKSAAELCVIPNHFPNGKYAGKDEDREADLCSYDIGVNVAACGKTNSSNPGINFHTSKTLSVEQLTAVDCEAEDSDKLAKYKLSTSCSYTPAILSYYHFSRLFGNILNVPVSVVRTMDLERHKKLATRAMEVIDGKEDLIYQTFESLMSALNAGKESRRADRLFVDGYQQTYGALSKNPKGEEFYSEFYNKGTDRAAAFKEKNPIYKELISSDLKMGRQLTQENLQKFIQLTDAGNMILMDTLLNQEDRFGNIHYEDRFYYAGTNKKGEFKIESESKLKDVPAEFQAKVLNIKEMILKDNDCGITRENRAKKAGLLDGIRHMDPKTYTRFQEFAASAATDSNKDFMTRELLMTSDDYAVVMKNAKEIAALLKSRCESGKLKLDLDKDLYFSGAALPTSYNCQ